MDPYMLEADSPPAVPDTVSHAGTLSFRLSVEAPFQSNCLCPFHQLDQEQDVQMTSFAWQAKKLDELQRAHLLGLSSTRRDPNMRQLSPNGIHKVEGKSSTSDYETAPSEVRCALAVGVRPPQPASQTCLSLHNSHHKLARTHAPRPLYSS